MRRVALLPLALAAGCDDFKLVGPQYGGTPIFNVYVGVQVEDSALVQFAAELRAGPVTPSSIVVEGHTVAPVARSSGAWTYEWSDTLPAAFAPTHLTIVTPSITGAPTPNTTITIPIPKRDSPVGIVLPVGQELRLHIAPSELPKAPLTRRAAQWLFDLERGSVGTSFNRVFATGNGDHAPEIRVPWDWINAAAGDSLVARLQTSSDCDVVGSAYEIRVGVGASLTWRIAVVAPP
jgi:hypothetical protein